MTGVAVLSVIWLAFLALLGIGLGVVWLAEQAMLFVQVVDEEYRRRVWTMRYRIEPIAL